MDTGDYTNDEDNPRLAKQSLRFTYFELTIPGWFYLNTLNIFGPYKLSILATFILVIDVDLNSWNAGCVTTILYLGTRLIFIEKNMWSYKRRRHQFRIK